MTGYTRKDTADNIANGKIINADDLDNEFNALQTAFNQTNGHVHDGTEGNAPKINTSGLEDNAVKTAKINNSAVTADKLASNAVTTAKITDANVTTAKIADDAVTTAKIAAGAVDTTELADASVTSAKLSTDAVALGTNTTGNYVAAGATSGVGLSGSVSSEGGTFTVTSNATSNNTANTIVSRDASGNFSAGTITANITAGTATITGGSISGITDLAIADGGTGASTASAARTNLGLGSLATKSTINNGDWSGTDLAVANGGTGASDAATARTNLGLAIGTNVQAYDAQLADIAGLAVTDGNFIVGNGANFVAENGATARTSLGLGSLATADNISNDDWSGTDLAVANGGTGLSTAPSNGQLLIGNGTGYTLATLTNGGNVTITNTAGGISLSVPDNTNTTYSISAELVGGDADSSILRLTDSSAGTDDITFVGGTNVTVTRTDANTITFAAADGTDTDTTYSIKASSTTGGANLDLDAGGDGSGTDSVSFIGSTNVTVTHTDANTITISATDTDTTYSAGTGLTLTGTTFSVTNPFTDADETKLDGIETGADVTDTANVVAALTAGSNITIAGDGTISSTDTNTTYSGGTGLTLSGTTFNVDTTQTITTLDNGNSGLTLNTGTENANNLKITSTFGTAISQAPDINLFRSYTTPANNDALGIINFSGKNAGGNERVYGSISAQALDVTNENGLLRFTVRYEGSNQNAAEMTNTEISLYKNTAISGNLSVTGTVDGRDISVDGTKLDGIEANATADQTKADIDALAINADQVDGLEASQFLRSDADDTGTNLTLTSLTTNDISSSSLFTIDSASGITLDTASEVQLRKNDVRYVSFESSGTNDFLIDVGNIYAPEMLFTGDETVRVTSNNSNALAGPVIDLYRDSASPAGSDVLGEIQFTGNDSDGSTVLNSRIYSKYRTFTSFQRTPEVIIEATTRLVSTDLVVELFKGSYAGISLLDGEFTIDTVGATFENDVDIVGALSKGSGSFNIKHPLASKADTHRLVHSFLEGPQADLIYRGTVDLVDGTASVNIDTVAGMTEGTFVALCRDVQCFTSNESGWTAIKGSVSGNILTIIAQDNTCTDTVSWMVVGERQDQHMYDTGWTDENGKVIVEPLIPVEENE